MSSLRKLAEFEEEGMLKLRRRTAGKPKKLWKTGHKIDFLENLHCVFMCPLFNFLQAILLVWPDRDTPPQ